MGSGLGSLLVGFRIVVPAESFYVTGTMGPLVQGETDRARRWAEQVVLHVSVVPGIPG